MKYTITSPSTFRSRMANKLKTIFPDENDCTNIEKAIFNYAIEESTRRKVIKKWENEHANYEHNHITCDLYVIICELMDINRLLWEQEIGSSNLSTPTRRETTYL